MTIRDNEDYIRGPLTLLLYHCYRMVLLTHTKHSELSETT